MSNSQEGVVIKSTGSWYAVKTAEGSVFQCRIPGKFRMKGIKSTNPVAVGDKVNISIEEDGKGVITNILERKNYIVRKSVNLSKRSHIIAANIDQAYLIVTIEQPETQTGFIDRFCVGAEAYHIPLKIIFNKLDLYSETSIEKMAELMAWYEDIGYPCLPVSAKTGEGIEQLKGEMANQTTLFSGNSGVGKSTLINLLEPGLQLKTLSISASHKSGQHTTTFAEMHPYSGGGYIIDTPGIKGFGLVDFDKEELAGYFPEMRELLPECKYYNCLHINEPGCAVIAALESGDIPLFRYKSYLGMYYDNEEDIYR